MARAKTISDDQLLGAAREVFLRRGPGASTLEIAEAAGVSEALLFKRFHSKEQLFTVAMSIAEAPAWLDRLKGLEGRGDLRANLIELSLLMLESMEVAIPRMMMVWASRREPAGPPGEHSVQLRALQALTGFFAKEMQLGRMRTCNAESLARTLIGAVVNQASSAAFGFNEQMAAPTFANGLVDTLWKGIAPEPAERAAAVALPSSGRRRSPARSSELRLRRRK